MPQCRWQVPLVNWVKVNFDATIFSDLRAIGIGVIIRNSSIEFLAGLCKKINALLSPASAEAVVAAHGVKFARDRGFGNAWFKGDAQ